MEKPVVAIVPALNEEATVGVVVLGLRARGVATTVVVDNGSTDGTGAAARAAGARVVAEPRRGYGRACLAGLAAEPDAGIYLFLDADGSDDLSVLPALLEPIRRGEADFLLATRMSRPAARAQMPFVQRWGNRLVPRLMRWAWGVPYTDMGPLRAIRGDALRRLDVRDPGFGWNIEMQIKAARAGLRVREVPAGYGRRRAGRSKISGTLGGTMRAGVKILWVLCRNMALAARGGRTGRARGTPPRMV